MTLEDIQPNVVARGILSDRASEALEHIAKAQTAGLPTVSFTATTSLGSVRLISDAAQRITIQ